MNEAHTGKIGRLPKALQEQVNGRLEQGEKGGAVVAWLNALPEVQAVLAAEFAGKPIREQNLSQWRRHGYQQWLGRQQAAEMVPAMTSAPPGQAGVSPQPATVNEPVTDQMAGWVTAHYLLALRKLVATSADGGPDLKTLRAFLQDVVAVRRGDHRAARMQIDMERRETRGKAEN